MVNVERVGKDNDFFVMNFLFIIKFVYNFDESFGVFWVLLDISENIGVCFFGFGWFGGWGYCWDERISNIGFVVCVLGSWFFEMFDGFVESFEEFGGIKGVG